MLSGMVRIQSILLSVAMLATVTQAAEFSGVVVSVADGDTITVLRLIETEPGAKKTIPVKIRLAGIDTPESKQAYGQKAKAALSSKVFGQTVRVVYSEQDRYGRTIGDVYAGGAWINLAMVSEGWAWHYKAYSKDKRLADAETQARKAKRGLWAGQDPVAPWEYRAARRRKN